MNNGRMGLVDDGRTLGSPQTTVISAVLMNQDDGFIQTLLSHMIAEAGVYRDEVQARTSRNPTRAVLAGTPAWKIMVQHDTILLLVDRTG